MSHRRQRLRLRLVPPGSTARQSMPKRPGHWPFHWFTCNGLATRQNANRLVSVLCAVLGNARATVGAISFGLVLKLVPTTFFNIRSTAVASTNHRRQPKRRATPPHHVRDMAHFKSVASDLLMLGSTLAEWARQLADVFQRHASRRSRVEGSGERHGGLSSKPSL